MKKDANSRKLSAELQHSARPGRVGGLVGGWVRKAEKKAKAQYSLSLSFAEFGNKEDL